MTWPPENSISSWRSLVISDPRMVFESSKAIANDLTTTHGAFISVVSGAQSGSGPLAGVPFAVKDNINTGMLPTSGGSAVLASSFPRADAGCVDLLRRAGGQLIGKTNLHELALGVTSNNAAFAPVRNPTDRERSAGGSSGEAPSPSQGLLCHSPSARTPAAR
jgi:hypothetical protein